MENILDVGGYSIRFPVRVLMQIGPDFKFEGAFRRRDKKDGNLSPVMFTDAVLTEKFLEGIATEQKPPVFLLPEPFALLGLLAFLHPWVIAMSFLTSAANAQDPLKSATCSNESQTRSLELRVPGLVGKSVALDDYEFVWVDHPSGKETVIVVAPTASS